MNRRNSMTAILLVSATLVSFAAEFARAAETFEIDGSHTSVLFRIKHLGVSFFYGRFTDVSGSVVLDDDPAKCSMILVIKSDSINTDSEKRDAHLKSPDFFNARQFPEITFKSTSIKAAGENQLEVTGDLTLHGVTKSITVTVDRTGSGSDPWGGYRTGLETTITIKRSDYGMKFMLKGLSDEVKLVISIEGIRQ